jgi:mRNA interferase RelE/StbE
MTWTLIIAKPAQRQLERVPRADQTRLLDTFEAMRRNPFDGDIAQLKNQPANFRRRVGAWRIFFDLDHDERRIEVLAIMRRTSTTYRRR